MADPATIERANIPGWTPIDLNKRNELSSEFTVDGNVYANVTNLTTGQRQLYLVSGIKTPFTGSLLTNRTLIYTNNSDGTSILGPGYEDYLRIYGKDKLNNALINNKRQSNYIISKASTQEEQRNLSQSKEYTSSLNAAQSSQSPDQQGGNPPASQNQPGGNPPAAGSGGGDTSTPITEIKAKTDPSKVIFKSKNPKRLQYPLDMKNDQDKIKFQACEFQKRDQLNTNGSTFGFTFPKPKYKPIELRVVLGIQSPISDQNSVDWNSGAAGAIETALYQESLRIIKGGATQQDITNLLKNATDKAKGYETQIQQALAGQAAGLGNVLARTDSAALNPNLELLFNGPQLRPFTFQFKMSARNEDEAIEIKNIIKYFKYYMAVRETTDGLFLKAPYVFTIQYKKGESPQHPGLNLISPNSSTKACALVNCSVDYTPLGSYMTYNDAKDPDADGTMVSYTLSLQFQEIEPIYNTDYEDDTSDYKVNKHPIGY